MTKLKKIEDLISISKRDFSSKIVLCHGVFDILHIGHIKHFQKAKEFGDILIVSLTSDKFVNKGLDRPIFNQNLRTEAISSLECVDYVYINDEVTPINLIKKIKPNYYIKGSDYNILSEDVSGNIIKEKKTIESVGGEFKTTNEIQYSSSNIINRSLGFLSPIAIDFLDRESFDAREIIDFMESIKNKRILVIGEAIIDEYHYGQSIGKSGKAPIVALKLERLERYIGGSLIIANHLSDFVNVDLLTAINPNEKSFVSSKLNDNVNSFLLENEKYVTITKKRYIGENQKLFETYKSNNNPLQIEIEDGLMQHLNKKILDYDLVIVCDFGHGLLTSKIREFLKLNAPRISINTQLNAGNMGNNTIRKYWDRHRDSFICIDETEIRLATCDYYNEFHSLEEIIKSEFSLFDAIAITRASKGCIIKDKNNTLICIPAFTNKIIDSTGAGDAFLSIASLLFMENKSKEWIGFLGNLAGAIASNYEGNSEHITKEKMYKTIETILK